MSYKVLKAQSRTLPKAKITIAWVEQVRNHSSSSSPAVPPPISPLVKETEETGLVFEPRDKNAGVLNSEQASRRSAFDRGTANEAHSTQDSKNSGRRYLNGKKVSRFASTLRNSYLLWPMSRMSAKCRGSLPSHMGLNPRLPAGQALPLPQFTAIQPVNPKAPSTEGPQTTQPSPTLANSSLLRYLTHLIFGSQRAVSREETFSRYPWC